MWHDTRDITSFYVKRSDRVRANRLPLLSAVVFGRQIPTLLEQDADLATRSLK